MKFPRRILIGLLLGVITGIVFGDYVAPLTFVADGFVRLLQVMVLPYVTLSIISSLGALTLTQARQLGLRVGAVLLGIWALAFTFTCLMPLAYPHAETASFFSTTLVTRPPPFDFVGLYIPSNPFNALANNVVPAVVLFSIMLGLALIGVERKQTLLDVLAIASAAVARATRAVTRLTPYGLFAIAAVAAGTMTVDQLQRIQVYLVTYVAVALILSLWVLPGLVTALSGIRIRDLFERTLDSLLVAFVAGDLFIVLPGLIEACKSLLEAQPGVSAETTALPDVIVPAGFNFPHAGKLLSLSFIPFAGWFAGAPLSLTDYPQLAGAGLLTFFGSLNSAVPFLLDLFRLPSDTFQLFLATGVINSRFGTLAAAVHTIALSILGSLALAGRLHWRVRPLVRYAVITAVVTIGTLSGLRVLFATALHRDFEGAEIVYNMKPYFGGAPAAAEPEPAQPPPAADADKLAAIRQRGVLRVGVVSSRLPYVFQNRDGRLVGYDVEMAQILARDLGVEPKFFAASRSELGDLIRNGAVDIGMSGLPATPDYAALVRFSTPYIDETFSFVVRDHLRDRFRTWASVAALGPIRLGMPDLPYYRAALQARAPNLQLVTVRLEDMFKAGDDVVGYILPAESGSVMTLLHPEYSVVVPEPDAMKLPIAYPVSSHDERWMAFINTWLELKRHDGTLDALYRHWILGQVDSSTRRRWSVIRNVLHWVD